MRLGASTMAARTLEHARKNAPDDANILITLGEIYYEEKEYEYSKDAFEAALAIEPERNTAQTGLAKNLMAIGQLSEAAEIYQNRIRAGHISLGHVSHLSHVPASMVTVDLFALIDDLKPTPGKSAESFQERLAFVKSEAFDKAGKHNDAWLHVCEARRFNGAASEREYNGQRDRRRHLIELAQSAKLDGKIERIASKNYPISLFIAGPSRSGKTSLERLVGSLDGVKRGYENPIVEDAVSRSFKTAGFPTRNRLAHMPPDFSDMFQKFYLEELAKRADTARVLTNTLPTRMEDSLRAAMEIPNARFVFVKRDLEDQTIRIFMRNYASGNHYASKIENIQDFVKWGHHMMDIAADKMPGNLPRHPLRRHGRGSGRRSQNNRFAL